MRDWLISKGICVTGMNEEQLAEAVYKEAVENDKEKERGL